MKFARYWPLAAVVFGVGLTYVVFAQADSKAPPQQLPQPVDAVFETAEAPWSPSDLPQLGVIYSASKTETACSSGQCKLTAKPDAATCRDDCAASCNTQAACASGCAQVVCESKCAVACDEACVSTCKTAKASVTAKTDCECGKNCACAKDCACGDKCQCRGDQAWKTAFAGACGVDCPCPVAGDYHGAAEWLPRPPHFLVTPYADPECGDYLARPSPSIKFWAPPPAAYHPGPVPFAPSYGPPPGFAPPPPPEMNRGMHEQVVRAMTETARLQARDEAWAELQKRDRALAELAVQNARLEAQVELASHKMKTFEQAAELLAKNAVLQAKLEAVHDRQELMEALMEVVTEKARLETATELLEVQHQIHAEAIGAMIETRQELFGPLHEALVENASLKAQAASKDEASKLQARIAELEKAVAKAEKQSAKIGVPATVKTARKPASETK
jgi:hypothetical protein